MEPSFVPPPPNLRIVTETDFQTIAPPDHQIQEIIVLLHADLRATHRIADLAQQVDISPRQFERRFKDATGYPLRQYLKKIRLEKASELLATTFLSIKEISDQVGLEAVNHFIADFKQVYRVTPVEYRKRMYGKWRACRIPAMNVANGL
jgi:AraC family transcriptional regulator, melibiose operon regulatory protein